MSVNAPILLTNGPIQLFSIKNLFEEENVFICAPLPSNQQIKSLVETVKCPKCKSNNTQLVDYQRSGPISALFYSCKSCSEKRLVFFSTTRLFSPDIIILLGPPHCPHNQDFFESKQGGCIFCGKEHSLSENHLSMPTEYGLKSIYPCLVTCSECGRHLNSLYFDSPQYYLSHTLEIALESENSSPRSSLVFLVASIEVYLRKIYSWGSVERLEEVKRRKPNFQQARDAKKAFKDIFDIDLVAVATPENWQIIREAFSKRHHIVHNGGYNSDEHMPIVIENNEIPRLKDAIVYFVDNLHNALNDYGYPYDTPLIVNAPIRNNL